MVYENAYKIMRDVRLGLNEYSDALLQGTDTSGIFTNDYLLQKINEAQTFIYNILLRMPSTQGFFYKSKDITGSNSVYALPWDFGRIIQFEDENGHKVYPSSPKVLPVTGQTGSDSLYYRSGNNLVLNKSGVSETYTLKYWKKPRYIHFGKAQSGSGSNKLIMQDANDLKLYDDYYNDMTVEDVTAAFVSTITDFTASTKEAVVSGTASEDDWYGIVPDLPDPFRILIAPWAVILTKQQHPASPEKPSDGDILFWNNMLSDALRSWAGTQEDIDVEDMFCDFGDYPLPPGGVNIPGQGYTIY